MVARKEELDEGISYLIGGHRYPQCTSAPEAVTAVRARIDPRSEVWGALLTSEMRCSFWRCAFRADTFPVAPDARESTRSVDLIGSLAGSRARWCAARAGWCAARARWCVAAASIIGALTLALALTFSAAPAGALDLPGGAPVSVLPPTQKICDPSQWPATSNPANPLDLATAPANGDPLSGAQFFVDGPAHGMAAGAIANLLGIDPSALPNDLSFASWWNQIGPLLAGNPSLASQSLELAKIAAQPEPQRLSLYSGGGGPGAIYGQTQKILCSNMLADPGTIPILETFFVYPDGAYCPSLGKLRGNTSTFRGQVTEFAQGIGRHPAVVLTELDSVGSAACMNQPSGTGRWKYWWSHNKFHKRFLPNPPRGPRLSLWAGDIAYELSQLQRYAPNTVLYTEAGYSDGNAPLWTAQMLHIVLTDLQGDGGSLARLRGFFTNDTHQNWSANEVRWAGTVSNDLARLTHGAYRAHFVVNTADNGQGPDIPANRVKNGNEILCNPPNRGLGVPDDTAPDPLLRGGPGFPAAAPIYLDAFLWVHTPGRSSGTCNGGPPNSQFWPARAEQMAKLANAQMGPPTVGWPSRPW